MPQETEYYPLTTDRYLVGLVTNASPLRGSDADLYDRIINGLNVELSSNNTPRKRPGLLVYNDQNFPKILSFYEFHTVVEGEAIIRMIADTDATVYDATGPSRKLAVWQKSPGAGKTRYQSVGNTLYFGNGVDQKKWILSSLTWKPNRLYNGPETSNVELGDYIIDSNNNIQKAVGAFTVGITNVAIKDNLLTLTLDKTQLDNPAGQPAFQVGTGGNIGSTSLYAKVAAGNALGLYTAAGSESNLAAVVGPNGSVQWTWAPVSGASSYRIYIGNTPGGEDTYFTTTTNTFTQITRFGTAGTPPVTNNAFDDALPLNLQFMLGVHLNLSGVTTATFLNGGTIQIKSVQPGGLGSNIVTADYAHADYASAPDTGSATSGTGITGGSEPAWQSIIGNVTYDGGAQWISRGNYVQNWGIVAPPKAPSVNQQSAAQGVPGWAANTYYTTSDLIYNNNGGTLYIQRVTTYGNTGTTEPTFATTPGDTTSDGSVIWTCMGVALYQTGTGYAQGAYILTNATDGNLYFYQSQNAGTSGGSAPSFPAPLNAQVDDNGIVWKNIGVGQVWSNITASVINSGFVTIPLSGGGSVTLGVGNGSYGSVIPLPSGYDASNSIMWASPAFASHPSNQINGVASTTAIGGSLQSAFNRRGGAGQTLATSNWAALAWTDGAAVSVNTVGTMTQVEFITQSGDAMCFVFGTLAGGNPGGTIPVPSGYSSSDFVGIIGAATVDSTSNGLQGLEHCELGPGLVSAFEYVDGSSNFWTGTSNVFGLFYKTGGGVSVQPITDGTAIIVTISPGVTCAIMQAYIDNGQSLAPPVGYEGSTTATCAMSVYAPIGGSNVAHGWTAQMSGLFYTGLYADSSTYTTGHGNIFAIATAISPTAISSAKQINDSNGNLQQLQVSGTSSSAQPTWATTPGVETTDNSATWLNVGAGTAAVTAAQTYYYAFKNSVDLSVSTASPASVASVRSAGKYNYIEGVYSNDPQVDTVVIYRTTQGGAIPFYLDEIPNVLGGQTTWGYADRLPDTALNNQIIAALNHQNDPPPAGLTNLSYHLSCVWGMVQNKLYKSTGPGLTTGNGNTAWQPSNVWPFPYPGHRLEPVAINNGGLLVMTTGDIYAMMGTTTDTLFPVRWAKGIGILSYDCVDVIGATIHMMTTAKKVISLDPSSGYSETGQPIGNQFKRVTQGGYNAALFSPATAFMTWHEQDSGETALYAADGAVGWFRWSPTVHGGNSFVWSPFGAIEGGTSAVKSVEVLPGEKQLLVGPATNGPILYRDESTNADNGVNYSNTYIDMGSFQLAKPGELAEVAAIILDSEKVGTPPTVGVLFGETRETVNVPFDMLHMTTVDPPNLPQSETLWSERFSTLQDGNAPLCRHMQLRIQWSQENVPNELLTHTIYGMRYSER